MVKSGQIRSNQKYLVNSINFDRIRVIFPSLCSWTSVCWAIIKYVEWIWEELNNNWLAILNYHSDVEVIGEVNSYWNYYNAFIFDVFVKNLFSSGNPQKNIDNLLSIVESKFSARNNNIRIISMHILQFFYEFGVITWYHDKIMEWMA